MLDLIQRDKQALSQKLVLPQKKCTREEIECSLYVLENRGQNIQKLGEIFANFVEIKEWNEFLLEEARRQAGSGYKSEEDYNEAVDNLINVVADDFWCYSTSDNQDLIFRV